MSVYVSNFDKNELVSSLSDELRNDIMCAVEASLSKRGLAGEAFQNAWDNAFNSKVCDLEDMIDVKYADEKLSFYVVENLRFQQDGGGFNLTRYDKLRDAIVAFADLPKEYTSALGASLTGGKFGIGELDLIHRKNGEAVQVNDFKFVERWDNPLVHRAVNEINSKLGVEYESDCRMFGDKSVLVPLQPWEKQKLNSYFVDKYLRIDENTKNEAERRYGDLSMYSSSASHPVHMMMLRSSVNEVLVGGVGWLSGEDFFNKLDSIDEYESPERVKVMNVNINYVDLNGRTGQADISPSQFALLKKQTIERSAQHPAIDEQIENANKVRHEQMEGKNRSKSKNNEKTEPRL